MKKVVFPTGAFISPGQRTIRVESVEEVETWHMGFVIKTEMVKTEEFHEVTIPDPIDGATTFTFEDKTWTIVLDSDEEFWGPDGKEGFLAWIDKTNKEAVQDLADQGLFEVGSNGMPAPFAIRFSKSGLEADHKTTMAHIMAELKLFPSVGQAKKNGWDKPIELGEHVVTKKKIRFIVLP